MYANNVDVLVCLKHPPGSHEFEAIVDALSGIRGVHGVTLNNHVSRLVNVNYSSADTCARAILDGVERSGHPSARLVGL